jgi:hypothetical protein
LSSQHASIIRKALAVVRPQFRLDFNEGIHGLPHWARVWHHGRVLAASLDVNPAVLAWFAFLHDSQRHNDRRDPEHGDRAADFAVGLRREGVIVELNDREFEQLCEAMRLHSDGHTASEPHMTLIRIFSGSAQTLEFALHSIVGRTLAPLNDAPIKKGLGKMLPSCTCWALAHHHRNCRSSSASDTPCLADQSPSIHQKNIPQ